MVIGQEFNRIKQIHLQNVSRSSLLISRKPWKGHFLVENQYNAKRVNQRILLKVKVKVIISKHLNAKKALGYDLIIGRILKELLELVINYLP